ncbi:MAG: phosphate acetyltransferase [Candidatus Cloacimonetes bacterium]|nr:phosphate acetyltransferase [Candidatus Cloacimonadota bacterium]
MNAFIESIRLRARSTIRRIVFPEGDDARTLDAVARLVLGELVRPVVLGDPDAVRAAVASHGADASAVDVIDPATDARRHEFAEILHDLRAHRGMTREEAARRVLDPLTFGALLVRTRQAHGSVAGAARTTADVLRAAIWCVGTAPGIRTVSSAFYMVVPPFRDGGAPEVLTFTDGSVVPEPTSEQLADIAAAAVAARRSIVGDAPRVAFLSFSTKGSAESESVERVRAAVERFRTLHPDVAADGELQVDAALIPAIAERKAPGSPIRGDANVLVFPNLDAGNIGYKLVQRLAHAEAIGPILQGLARPCNDLSRGASAEDIVNVACITALQGG